jgi:hypothetical protein
MKRKDIHEKENTLNILAYADNMPRRLFAKLLANDTFRGVHKGLFVGTKAKRVIINKLTVVKFFDGTKLFFVKNMPDVHKKALRMLLNVLKKFNKFKRTLSVYELTRAGIGSSVTGHTLYTTWLAFKTDSNSGVLEIVWAIDALIIVHIKWDDKERLYFINDYWFSLGPINSDNFTACIRYVQ